MIITLQTLIFFRESLLNALDRLLRPYYKKLSLAFGRHGEASDDEESDEQVFAEYDDERGVVFYPPMYLQRYAAVSDCLMDEQWCGKLEKIVDLGYHDMSFINYLKEVQGVKCILGVDLESIPLRCSIDLVGGDDYVPKRENPLEVTLFKGNAADPDYRLIGCDAVIAIEMIEHMLPHDLDRLIHTVFGFIKPRIAIFTTPNGDFNVLFKALEKNGLRRLDHFFEWSRDQFHDWCSNIVVRYPQYTVSCKGIGPGPAGTKHLGCCSQMALFVAKDYMKQQDLNLNSLALVAESPSPHSISNLISSWETPDIPNESIMIEPPKNTESYSELRSEMQSSITLYLSTPSSSLDTIMYQDKTSQCNLDSETERSYLMFDYEQMCCEVLKPRRNLNNHRVYDIEDVYNRLNCTTLEVKKFSKTTLNLMAKNKLDTLVHTREVVDEIRHLTKLLNFNKELNNQLENGIHTWYNINWGENAPYWNQYYKIVKAYNYPFEVKSDECRILDLISDEINRLIDTQLDEDFSFEVNKLEIPLELLMRVVEHITDDVDKVKDLLEWNGYEVLGEFVIHSRMVVDYSSAGTQEDDSLDTTDIYSDWDSTSLSDGSTTVPDYHGRNTPPPTKWMQCKLLDLLTLTEKTIERRKRHFIESYPLKVINYEENSREMIALKKIKEDNTALRIVDKYQHLVNQTENVDAQYRYIDFDLEDDLSAASTDFVKDCEFVDRSPINPNSGLEPCTEIFESEDIVPPEDSKLQRTQAWVEEDIEVVPYPVHDGNFDNSSIETDHNATKFSRYYKKKYKEKQCIELNCVIHKKSHSKACKLHRTEDKNKDNSKTKLVKKVSRKKSINSSGVQTTRNKIVSVDSRTYRVRHRKKQYKCYSPTAAKPIPASLIELCHPEMMVRQDTGTFNLTNSMTKVDQDKTLYNMESEVAASKESMLIEIITESAKETIALHRTIGTNADTNSMVLEDETLIRSVSNTFVNDHDGLGKHDNATENINSQTIFLYDIDEPTTSKGIRHMGMDVQCGPDATAPIYAMLSATTSSTRVPKMFMTGIKIGDSSTDTKITSQDFGTCTQDAGNSYRTIIPNSRSTGIKIKDSDSIILVKRINCSTASTYSAPSSTTSLTRESKIVTAGIYADDFIENTEKGSDFGTSTNIPEQDYYSYNFETDKIVNISLNHSISKITAQSECITDTNKSSHYELDSSKVTTIFESLQVNDDDKNPHKDVIINMQCSTTTQELYDKLIASSQQLYTKKSEILRDRHAELNSNVVRSHLSNQAEHILKTHQANDKSNPLPQKTFKRQLSPRGAQKKSVDCQLQNPVSHITKRLKCSSIVKPRDNTQAFSFIQKTSVSSKMFQLKRSAAVSDSEIQNEVESLTNTNSNNLRRTLTPSPPAFSKRKTLMISKQEDVSLDVGNESNNTVSPRKINCLVETHVHDTSAVDSTFETPIFNTLCNNDHQPVISVKVLNNAALSVTSRSRKSLCSGGIQVHSYRDKQALSEDIMFQGQWQQSNPKVLARKKGCIPILSKKIDTNLKKKVNSRELLKPRGSSCERRRNYNNKANSNLKSDLRQPLVPHNTIFSNSKIQTDFKGKQDAKLSNTVCVATVAKPFRNILKVPSKFPISTLPKNIKSFTHTFNTTKHPKLPTAPVKKEDKPARKGIKKNYIPLYLRQRGSILTNKASKTDLNLSFDLVTSAHKKNNVNIPNLLVRAKTEEINHRLIKFRTKPLNPEYVVFRNEIEKKKSNGQQIKNTSESARRKDVSRQRSSTPTSANSSTCSSPCSIATVRTRTKNASNRRHSSPSYVNNIANSSENSSPDRDRKFTKRCKTARVTVENKENIPETSKTFNAIKKATVKLGKDILLSQKNDIYTPHVKDGLNSSINTKPKNKHQKPNVNIPIAKSFSDKKLSPHPSRSLSNKKLVMLDASLSATRVNEISECAQTSNMVLIVEPQPRQLYISPEHSKLEDTNIVNQCLAPKNVESIEKDFVEKDDQSVHNIHSTIKEMLEESLDFLENPLHVDVSNTVIVHSENLIPHMDSPLASPTSFKTVVTSDDNDILSSDIELALNRSFDVTLGNESALSLNETHFTVTDLDGLSFKSMTSGSKLSGYLSADTEFGSSIKMPKCTISSHNATSVRELFERKEQPLQPAQNQNTSGSLANQVFSGFTINEDSIAGDKPDLINLIDSETGSLLAVAIPRQATSEELLISGRSSESFESCLLDDDTVVPNWLFQLINQQASLSSLDEIEPPADLGSQPPVDPLFDDNANVVEAPGAGAGAGDGRGIHSDHSQDSSGRGTSVSSSESSSGPQSEVVLIDPAAFAAQFELLRDAVEGSVVLAISNPESLDNATGSRAVPGIPVTEPQSYSGGESRRIPRIVMTSASDADADISSLETDVLDSSDN